MKYCAGCSSPLGNKKKCQSCGQAYRWLERFEDDDREEPADSDLQEDLGEAHVAALAACCGLVAAPPGKDRFGYDRRIEPKEFSWNNGAELRIQIKCLYRPKWKGDNFLYKLGERKYERLRKERDHLPVLVVVTTDLPRVPEWANCSQSFTQLNAVAYFSVIPYTIYAERLEKGIRLYRRDMLTHKLLLELLRMANERPKLEQARRGERPWA